MRSHAIRNYMNHRGTDWSLYRSFLAVLQEGSLSAAARALALTQPTIARHIEALGARCRLRAVRTLAAGLKPDGRGARAAALRRDVGGDDRGHAAGRVGARAHHQRHRAGDGERGHRCRGASSCIRRPAPAARRAGDRACAGQHRRQPAAPRCRHSRAHGRAAARGPHRAAHRLHHTRHARRPGAISTAPDGRAASPGSATTVSSAMIARRRKSAACANG